MANMANPDGVRRSGQDFHGFSEQAQAIAERLKDLQMAKAMGAAFAEEAEAMQRGLDKVHVPFQHHGEYNAAFGAASTRRKSPNGPHNNLPDRESSA